MRDNHQRFITPPQPGCAQHVDPFIGADTVCFLRDSTPHEYMATLLAHSSGVYYQPVTPPWPAEFRAIFDENALRLSETEEGKPLLEVSFSDRRMCGGAKCCSVVGDIPSPTRDVLLTIPTRIRMRDNCFRTKKRAQVHCKTSAMSRMLNSCFEDKKVGLGISIYLHQ